jgi:hypothetical protein
LEFAVEDLSAAGAPRRLEVPALDVRTPFQVEAVSKLALGRIAAELQLEDHRQYDY